MDSLSDMDAVIFDNDGTICKKSTAFEVGKKLIWEQYPQKLDKFLRGIYGVCEVGVETMKRGPAYGLKKFFDVMGEHLDVSKSKLEELTYDVVNKNELPGFSDLNSRLQERGIKTCISTMGYDQVCYALLKKHKMDAFSANPVNWIGPNDEIVSGDSLVYIKDGIRYGNHEIPNEYIVKNCDIPIHSSDQKLKANKLLTRILGVDDKKVAMVGDDSLDLSSMKFYKPVAGPLANKEIIEFAEDNGGFQIKDYYEAAKLI